MSEDLSNFEPYILNESNIQEYLKYKPIYEAREKNKINYNAEINKSNLRTPDIFIPKEQDPLFWCYYIIKNGFASYETQINKNLLFAKQTKIKYVDLIRENKQIVKTYKFDTITNIESNLANDNIIDAKTILTLCAIENINVIYVKGRTYFELMMNDSDKIYVIKEIPANKNYQNSYKKYGFEMGTEESIENIKSTLYRVNNINKPIKGLSAYKVQDLIDIATKLAIQIKNSETGKNKSKNELYELIIQYF